MLPPLYPTDYLQYPKGFRFDRRCFGFVLCFLLLSMATKLSKPPNLLRRAHTRPQALEGPQPCSRVCSFFSVSTRMA